MNGELKAALAILRATRRGVLHMKRLHGKAARDMTYQAANGMLLYRELITSYQSVKRAVFVLRAKLVRRSERTPLQQAAVYLYDEMASACYHAHLLAQIPGGEAAGERVHRDIERLFDYLYPVMHPDDGNDD